MDKPEILMTPGPTPVPAQVLLAQGSPFPYHRGPGYTRLLTEVTDALRQLMHTEHDVLLFASSGTGALESVVANLFSPGDRVLVPVAGYFGERFAGIARAFGLDVVQLDYEWGTVVPPEDLQRELGKLEGVKGLLVQHSETSTGVIHDIEAIGRIARHAGVLLAVDAISSLGAVPYEGDAWGIDVCVGGSQKAMSATPGLAFVSVSPRAWEASETASNPRFYFDWRRYKEAFEKDGDSPFTPALSLMLGMKAALDLYFEEGQEAVLERHRLLSDAVKEGCRALGLDIAAEHPERAWAVTQVAAPEGIDGTELVAKVRRDHGIILAPGQGPLKGKVFRIGHLGHYDQLDILRGLAALEMTLGDMGYPVKPGAGVAAAEAVFNKG
ncbi:MAG: alanine--glyoxylate aminotransferase family protein [Actinomycetota bacterium]